MNIVICPLCKCEFIKKSNRQVYCSKECFKKYYIQYDKKYKMVHAKELKEYSVKYYKTHKKEKILYNQKYRLEHKEEIRIHKNEYMKKYVKEHKEQRKKYIKKYYKLNKEKIMIEKRLYMNNKCKNDMNFKILCRMRHRLYMVLKQNSKSSSTVSLLGCSIDFLKHHLESKFTKGMSFSNYGKWHIDHIRPCASFDLSKSEEQRKCFHYTNLQPLWAGDNIRKSDTYLGEI